jgi:hypothetical protein
MNISQCKGIFDSILLPALENEKDTMIIRKVTIAIMGRGGNPSLAKTPNKESTEIREAQTITARVIFFLVLPMPGIRDVDFFIPSKMNTNVAIEIRLMMIPEISSGFILKFSNFACKRILNLIPLHSIAE